MPGTRNILDEFGPAAVADWMREQKQLLITDTTMRDGHQSLLATRMRSIDMIRVAPSYAANLPELFSVECWGGPTFDVAEKIVSYHQHLLSRPRAFEMLTSIATGMSSDGQQGVLPVSDILGLPMPKTVLWGTDDNVLPVSQLEQFERHAATHRLEGVGHSPAEEATDQVKAAIFAQLDA